MKPYLSLNMILIMTFLSEMAKKFKKLLSETTHRQCKHCKQVGYEYLNYKGDPIMGECIYCKTRFLLNEKTECKYYE